MSHPYGFLDYEEDDSDGGGLNSVILSCQCTSLAEVQAAGGISVGAGHTFDSVRGLIGGSGGGIQWIKASTSNANFAARCSELKNSGHVTFWVEKAFIERSVTDGLGTNEYFLRFGSGSYPTMLRYNGSPTSFFADRMGGSNVNYCYSTSHGHGALIRIDISWTGNPGGTNYYSVSDFYIDKVLIARNTLNATANWADDFFSFWTTKFGTGGVAASSGALYRLQISTRPITLVHPRPHLAIATFGDSITTKGGRYAYTPIAPNVQASIGTYGDAGYVMGIRRLFAERNLYDYVLNYAVSGTQSSSFSTHIANCFNAGHFPKYATVMYGANDAAGSVTAANYDTNIRTGLTDLFDNRGITKVFIIKPPSVYNQGTYQSQAYVDLIDGYGSKIDAMAADYPNLVIVDGLTATGGHTSGNDNFESNDIHLTFKGNRNLSDALNAKLSVGLVWN